MAPAPAIVWFRQDLRLADQPALAAALDDGPVLPVFVLDDADETMKIKAVFGPYASR